MNQIGLPMTISLVLAREAGVKDPALDKAIDKSSRFLRYYVDKGAIPYGDHPPWGNAHDDNGKSSCAAVLFDMLGDRDATSFNSWMATAAYDNREHGHCGNVWNVLWALPGASRSGPLATGAYLKEQAGNTTFPVIGRVASSIRKSRPATKTTTIPIGISPAAICSRSASIRKVSASSAKNRPQPPHWMPTP